MSSSSEPRRVRKVDLGDLRGEASDRYGRVTDAELRRLIDPASAVRTVHWGGNYLYEARLETGDGPVPVVVKAFRRDSLGRRISARMKGSRALRSWRASLAMLEAGVAVPEPVAYLEAVAPGGGASYFICELVPDALESRYLFRALRAGTASKDYPDVDVADFLGAVGAAMRRLHDARLWHRDLSVGNVLLTRGEGGRRDGPIYLLDLNRTRIGRRLSRSQRMRDLCRLPVERPEDRRALLGGYFPPGPPALDRRLFLLAHRSFHARLALKARLKRVRAALRGLVSRGAHAHIPAPPEGAATEDRVVWDALSDQPHLHAGRLRKARVRMGNAASHLREAAVIAAAAVPAWTTYRKLRRQLYAEPVALGGLGVGLLSGSAPVDELAALVGELGVRHALVRVQVWDGELERDRALASALASRGCRVVISVPQNRDLVRDPDRWRRALEEVRDRFGADADCVLVGHAINRSKWGVWSQKEYSRLLAAAAEVLRPVPGLRIGGPSVIDFELHQTALALGWAHPLHFDVISSLLYVDRRGAPENRQAGLDTVDKMALLEAIIRTSRGGDRPSWITEVNWPLGEGPHSPAGRLVAVDERRQADYLARYFLLGLATGLVERIYWWQLVARGYGLVAPEPEGPRRRPAFEALRRLAARL
ncbi:MAG: lipopolysaccharide kinase InaA family protein, partial [Thermoanaerobaculia bacterium]|nr:lipopolysaccharide kinase InaA family protein [Thermoanaerobaculia bacterium]